MLKVNEIFLSLIGESLYSGYPFIIIRLTGCPLRCNWCDTKYSYEEGIEYSIESLVEKIFFYNLKKVLLTGGEPLCQKDSYILIDELLKKDYFIAIETGGSQSIKDLNRRVHIILDYKLPSSQMEHKMMIENFDFLKPNDEIKFVIGNLEDYKRAKEVLDKYELISKAKITFSPVFDNLNSQLLARWILTDKLDVRLQFQIHKLLWPDRKRGI